MWTGLDRDSLATFYFDGANIGTVDISAEAGGTINSGSGLLIGKHGETTTNWFDGLIDDVRIYNRALSPQEIKRLYLMNPSGL